MTMILWEKAKLKLLGFSSLHVALYYISPALEMQANYTFFFSLYSIAYSSLKWQPISGMILGIISKLKIPSFKPLASLQFDEWMRSIPRVIPQSHETPEPPKHYIFHWALMHTSPVPPGSRFKTNLTGCSDSQRARTA